MDIQKFLVRKVGHFAYQIIALIVTKSFKIMDQTTPFSFESSHEITPTPQKHP